VLIASAAILVAIPNIFATFRYTDPRQLNTVLARTGAALVVFTVLFSIGWMI
jgi:1,4-dihydroxy-2-naphthoate octaprenyltransferase